MAGYIKGITIEFGANTQKLNAALIDGVSVIQVYNDGRKIRDLALLACSVDLEYDSGVPADGQGSLEALFALPELLVEKRSKNGTVEQNIIPMIRKLTVETLDANVCRINALVCCQNPTLNPALLVAAIERYLPQLRPDFAKICRNEIFDGNETIFR